MCSIGRLIESHRVRHEPLDGGYTVAKKKAAKKAAKKVAKKTAKKTAKKPARIASARLTFQPGYRVTFVAVVARATRSP